MCNVQWRACCRSYPPWCTAPHFLCLLEGSLDHLLHKFISQSHTKIFTGGSIVFHDTRKGMGLCLWMEAEKNEDLEDFGNIETVDQLSNLARSTLSWWQIMSVLNKYRKFRVLEFLIWTVQSVSLRTELRLVLLQKDKRKKPPPFIVNTPQKNVGIPTESGWSV